MREIKFRAWDEGNKVMHNDVQFIRTGISGNDWICFASKENPYRVNNDGIILNNPFFSQQIILLQYTGLKDKNGKEIYEGDIFKYLLPDIGCEEMGKKQTYTEYTEVVVFEDGQFTLEVMPVYAAKDEGEIIGNIYENQELINTNP